MFLNFIYLFIAVLGLCCYAGFSLGVESWSYSLGCAGSVAVVHGLSCSMACGVFMDLPGSGIEPVPPARAGGFFTPESPGKPDGVLFFLFLFFLVLPLYCYQPISLHPHAHMLSHVIPWTSACQTPLSMDFSRQEYWSGLPFPSPRCYF